MSINERDERITAISRRIADLLFPAQVVIPTGNNNIDKAKYEHQGRLADMNKGAAKALYVVLPFMSDEQLEKVSQP
jgi:hypothetical protein